MENLPANHTVSVLDEDIYGPKRDSLFVVIPITIIYAIIFVTGLIGNISTCIVISRNKSMHTATNYYLFSLAISDLLLLVSGLPQEAYSIWSRYPYIFGQTFCVLRGLFAETSANATVLTITAFTVERYVAICHPFLSHTMSKLSRAVKLILGIWILSVCFAVPQALQLDVYALVEGDLETKVCYPRSVMLEHVFTISTVVFFVVPMVVISVLYVLIGLRLRGSPIASKSSVPTVQNYYCESGGRMKRNRSFKHQGQSSGRVVKMLVAVVVAFFICWAPFHVQRLLAIYGPQQSIEARKLYEIVTYTSGVLYYMSTTVNPLLYNIMSNKFREAFKETFSRCCRMAHVKSRSPQRSYSVLSRSVQRGHSSTSSGRDEFSHHNHSTSMIHRDGWEQVSYHAGFSRRTAYRSTQPPSPYPRPPICNCSTQTEWPVTICDTNFTVIARTASNPSLKNITVHFKEAPATRFRFWRMFHCLAKQSMKERTRRSRRRESFASPVRESHILMELDCAPKMDCSVSMSLCDISNSSLKETGSASFEDELTIYLKEMKERELFK